MTGTIKASEEYMDPNTSESAVTRTIGQSVPLCGGTALSETVVLP